MKTKPLDERVREAVQVRTKMRELGVDDADDAQVRAVHVVLADFVRGHAFAGTLPLDRCGRDVVMKLSSRKGVENHVILRPRADDDG